MYPILLVRNLQFEQVLPVIKCSSDGMVDMLDLGSSVERRVGSSPTLSTAVV
jgi:hypothetical protein